MLFHDQQLNSRWGKIPEFNPGERMLFLAELTPTETKTAISTSGEHNHFHTLLWPKGILTVTTSVFTLVDMGLRPSSVKSNKNKNKIWSGFWWTFICTSLKQHCITLHYKFYPHNKKLQSFEVVCYTVIKISLIYITFLAICQQLQQTAYFAQFGPLNKMSMSFIWYEQ